MGQDAKSKKNYNTKVSIKGIYDQKLDLDHYNAKVRLLNFMVLYRIGH